MNHDYRYLVNNREVFPTNASDFKLSGKKPADFWRTFVYDFNSTIVFDNHTGDFNFLKQYEGTCEELSFTVYKGSVIKFAGYFTCSTGEWNNDRNTVELKVKPNDESRAIIEGLKVKQNILALGLDRVTTTGITMPTLAYSDREVIKQTSYFKVVSGQLVREDFNIPNASGTPIVGTSILGFTYPYYRNAGNPLTFTIDQVDSVTGEPIPTVPDQWGALDVKIKLSNDQDNLYNPGGSFFPAIRIIQTEVLITEIYTVEGTDTSTPPALGAVVKEVTNINGIDVVIWWRRPNYSIGVAPTLPLIENSGITVDSPLPYKRWKLELSDLYPTVEYTRNLYLYDVLQAMLEEIGYTGTLQSKFFTENINYVLNEKSRTNKITIAQRSDIELPTSTEPATLAEITLQDLLGELNKEFYVYLGYDNGNLALEHYSYWGFSVYDATIHEANLKKSDNYAYLDSKFPFKETWTYSEAQNTDFLPNSITYNSSCVDKENEVVNQCKFCNDLAYMAASGVENKVGFVLLANEEINGTLYVINEPGFRSGGIVANGHLSLSNLMNYYHRHNRVLIQGLLNFETQTFESVSKKRAQVITIPGSFDYNNDVKTNLGIGEVEQFEESLQKKHVKLTINHD